MNKAVLDIVAETNEAKRTKRLIADFIWTMTNEDGIGTWAMKLAGDLEQAVKYGYGLGQAEEYLNDAASLTESRDFRDDYKNLCADIETWKAPATMAQIKIEVVTLLAAYPGTGKEDLSAFAVLLARDIEEKAPKRYQLTLALRKVRHTSKFRPSIAEVLHELKQHKRIWPYTYMFHILKIPEYVAELKRLRPALAIEHKEAVPFDSDLMDQRQPVSKGESK